MNFSLQRVFVSWLTFWLVVVAAGLYFVLPLRQSLRFGIDLVGGTYLTLEVQSEKAVEAELVEQMQSVDAKLKRKNLPVPSAKSLENGVITLTFGSFQDAQSAVSTLKSEFKDLTLKADDKIVTMQFSDREAQRIRENAVSRNIEVLRTRMRDIPIAKQGERNMIVELPDVADPQTAMAKIGKAAQLEFRLVEKAGRTPDDIRYEYDGDIPSDKEILPGKDASEGHYLVERYADVTGRYLKDARPAFGGQTGVEPVVSFKFNEVGAEKFYALTSKNYGRALAIVLDGVVISAPRINNAIRGEGVIEGRFTPEEAKELALLLTSGSFIAPVTFEEKRQIGPTLGAESINQGLTSCLVGLALLFLFSLFYYSISGFFAFLALIYNLCWILIGLAWLQTPLTLPGIGGMVLTVGMAIDASILIYERIKEEISKGMTIKKAVDAGFSGAMKVILDGNITTLIVGIVLYNFGSGPIQGFAVTTILGIIATLISSLFFLRSLFHFTLRNFNVQKLRI